MSPRTELIIGLAFVALYFFMNTRVWKHWVESRPPWSLIGLLNRLPTIPTLREMTMASKRKRDPGAGVDWDGEILFEGRTLTGHERGQVYRLVNNLLDEAERARTAADRHTAEHGSQSQDRNRPRAGL